ncbi:MAG: hypothetical protein Q4C00_00610 [Bacillota bacterium]|nr:hypothetical protein [Bacillota bacterium]
MDMKNVLAKIEQYLEGNINAEDFSYDFPVTYSLYAQFLDKTAPELSRLLDEELRPLCKSFDPFDFYNIEGEKCLSETDFRRQVENIYRRAKSLTE